jgi:endonuclease-8
VGRTVERVESRGKWLLIHFSNSIAGDERLILVTHMLMSGSWHLYRPGERWRMGRWRMRVLIRTTPEAEGQGAWEAVAFNVPIAEFHTARSLERSSQVPKLGPDVLSNNFTTEAGVTRLQAYARKHPEAEVGAVLLNQRVLAGLGNVYKSEVAFAAGVNPFRQINTLTDREIDVMAEFALKWMKANVHDGQQRGEAGEGIVTYTGPRRTTHAMDRSDRTFVYGRQGMECRRCGAIIERRLQGVAARPTYWCPGCQPWVASAGQSEAPPVGRKVKLVGKRRKIGC